MKKNPNHKDDTERRKKKKKRFSPYKKDKYTLSKLREYENYLEYIENVRNQVSNQGNLETE